MIGKKSKFEEHGKPSVQVQENLETSGDKTLEKRKPKKRTSSKLSDRSSLFEQQEDVVPEEQDHLSDIADPTILPGSPDETQIEKVEEETIKAERKHLFSEGNIGETSSQSSLVTILTPQHIKTDTDLLWDEICNGVKGKNSGIPMGFNRLNKYLGLRKSIYTTIGAAAG